MRPADGDLLQLRRGAAAAGAVLRLDDVPDRRRAVAATSARGQVRVLKTSVPYVARVENRSPAIGGAEAETLDDAKARGPLLLRSRGRAVTAEDFEELAREVAPDAARVHCVPEPPSAARACGCWWCRTWPATTSAGSSGRT